MSPTRQQALGIAGCKLVPGPCPYALADGKFTVDVVLTVSLLCAEPCLHRFHEAPDIGTARAIAMGYRFVRNYDDAVAVGLV